MCQPDNGCLYVVPATADPGYKRCALLGPGGVTLCDSIRADPPGSNGTAQGGRGFAELAECRAARVLGAAARPDGSGGPCLLSCFRPAFVPLSRPRQRSCASSTYLPSSCAFRCAAAVSCKLGGAVE